MRRQLELDARTLGPGAAVLDVMGEALLARVEIDGGDALAGLEQGNGNVQRRCRFARTALFIAEHHNMG